LSERSEIPADHGPEFVRVGGGGAVERARFLEAEPDLDDVVDQGSESCGD
jgi:hypothetical protein